MKLLLRCLGWLIAISIAGGFVWFVYRTFRLQDISSLTTFRMIAAMFSAACLYALIIPISGATWGLLLRRQGETWSSTRLATIMAVTQLAKYIPGNVAQHISRAGMSLRQGITLRALTVTVFQESVLAIAASVATGLFFLFLTPFGIEQIPVGYLNICLLGTFVAIAIVVTFAFGPILLPKRMQNWHWVLAVLRAVGPALGANLTLIAFSAYCLNYMIIGIGIWTIGQTMGLGANGSYLLLTAAFSLAWLLGFVMPGAPAGLGVREGVMALLLVGAIPQHQILSLVLAVRLATVAGDGICFGFGLLGLRYLTPGRK